MGWGAIGLLLGGILLWKKQQRSLRFIRLGTRLTKDELLQVIGEVGNRYHWVLDDAKGDSLVIHTLPTSIWSLTWGEQIFIVFEKGGILVNSVNDLNKHGHIFSFGYNKRNIQILEEAIRSAEKKL